MESGGRDGIGTEYETAFVVDILEDPTVSDQSTEGWLRGSKLWQPLLPDFWAGIANNVKEAAAIAAASFPV